MFMDIMEACMEYARSFSVSYNVNFEKGRSVDIRMDMMSANVLDGASDSTCKRYIRLTK